jgi:acyl-coenzyme A synthetase/AMP-(fatty) acid ligase
MSDPDSVQDPKKIIPDPQPCFCVRVYYTNITYTIQGELFGCVADVGWITGHSYVVYGPLGELFAVPTHPLFLGRNASYNYFELKEPAC